MAEGTYEYECMRAELLGLEKPDQEEFEKARAERLKREAEEHEAAAAEVLDNADESMKNVGGRLDELNSILSSTQQKLNRFKQSACGSISNMFGRNSVDIPETGGGGSPSTSASGSRRNTTAGGDIASAAVENRNEVKQEESGSDDVQPVISTEKILAAKLDIQRKMTSHMDRLDALIHKTENAEVSMSEQTKQMRKMAK